MNDPSAPTEPLPRIADRRRRAEIGSRDGLKGLGGRPRLFDGLPGARVEA